MEKIGEIKARFAEAGERLKKASIRTGAESAAGLLENLEQAYREDTRSGVQALIQRSEKQRETLEKETARIYQLQQYEREYEKEGLICGIDEVGRGPLAGPVVAGAVILPKNCEILYLNDSKQLSAEKREQLYDVILEHAVAVGIGIVSPQRIDEINILQATYEAMRQAIEKLNPQPAVLLNDAVRIPQVAIQQVPIIKGDAKSVSIAAASIVAKVTRDRMMEQYEEVFPGYGFARNKGYGSKEHIEALQTMGPTAIHRRSFIGHFVKEG
ncbi:MAG: ribonuclease HII [Lachnospiraceae bacterium]|nr:ribonuclease HII [Lachnospiraceae bacterium]